MQGRKLDPIDTVVGARIRLRRKFLGVSQQALAEALGMTFQQVQKYERGTNRVSASVLVKIARKLGCPVSYLVGEEEVEFLDDGMIGRLTTVGAVELLDVFSKLPDERSRRAVLVLARALAEPAPAAAAAAADSKGADSVASA